MNRTIFEDNKIYFPNANMDEGDEYTAQVTYYAKNIGYLHESFLFSLSESKFNDYACRYKCKT